MVGGSSGKGGVPYFATPWIELGKLEEREKWQTLAVELVEHSIASELQELKHSLSDPLARLPELKQNLASKVDQAQAKISSLVADYRRLLVVDGSSTVSMEKKAIMHALQHQARYEFELESVPDTAEDVTATITEEFAIEESAAHASP
ncbi:hypothetical protein GOP47_0007712 [Adiantum capillus-veneris]|uniref:Uncharacterized protein n=1 Tax=Adiantum capillus-veneris TaxID=13818 RepID=A0A9D4ZJH4_ADICA|nr:hypothetical protein GOP47_0007712 [Adiantum capillus-veneris]